MRYNWRTSSHYKYLEFRIESLLHSLMAELQMFQDQIAIHQLRRIYIAEEVVQRHTLAGTKGSVHDRWR